MPDSSKRGWVVAMWADSDSDGYTNTYSDRDANAHSDANTNAFPNAYGDGYSVRRAKSGESHDRLYNGF